MVPLKPTQDDWTYPDFSKQEMACKCGCGRLPEHSFMQMLQSLRTRAGFPLRVTSGFRCPTHNARVSSTGFTGPHTTGLAADISLSGRSAYEIVGLAIELGFTGIGVKQKGAHVHRFLHLDAISPDSTIHPRPWVWSY